MAGVRFRSAGLSGNYGFTVEVADSNGNVASKSLEIEVEPDWELTFNLSFNIIGNGTVTSNPPGIDCPGDCSESYPAGSQVTLTATPAPGSSFDGWIWFECSGTDDCVMTMWGDIVQVAYFSELPIQGR